MLKAYLAQDIRYRISNSRSRCKRQIYDSKWDAESSGCFLCYQLSYSGDLEGCLLDGLAEYLEVRAAYFLKSMLNNSGAGYADVDDRVRLCHAVESTCHEGIVIRCIAEYNKLRAAKAFVLLCGLGCLLTISPISLTASILIPVLVEPTLTELQISSVCERACGIDLIRSSSALVIPLLTSAE